MVWVFVERDPEGRLIGLDDNRWQQHVLGKRPFLANKLREIKDALKQPQAIYPGNKPLTLLYEGQLISSGFHQGEQIRVAVGFDDKAYRYGKVRTIYITSQPHKGVKIWPP